MKIPSKKILKLFLIRDLFILFFSVVLVNFLFVNIWGINFFTIAAPATVYYPGSEFQVCAGHAVYEPEIGHDSPHPTFDWTFESAQSDYSDGITPPQVATPIIGPSEQVSFWIEVDDDYDFSSIEWETGEIASTTRTYYHNGDELDFDVIYFWRIKVKDTHGTVSSWINGEAFYYYSPNKIRTNSIRLREGVNLKGGINFK